MLREDFVKPTVIGTGIGAVGGGLWLGQGSTWMLLVWVYSILFIGVAAMILSVVFPSTRMLFFKD